MPIGQFDASCLHYEDKTLESWRNRVWAGPHFTSQFTDDDNASQPGGPEEDQLKLLWETMLDIHRAARGVGLEPTS